MRLEYQVLAAVAIDLALGDPRWLPHPVRGIGRLAARLEMLVRGRKAELIIANCKLQIANCKSEISDLKSPNPQIPKSPNPQDPRPGVPGAPKTQDLVRLPPSALRLSLAGLLVALTVYAVAGLAAWGAIALAGMLHPAAADAVAVFVIYAAIAPRDLARHSTAVRRALAGNDLVEARRRVGQIVGRDTGGLDEAGVVRAAVESVAESTVDGVTAPLFFAVVAGPVGAIVYRAVNTLDSLFGHQDERYRDFGWAAARIDDLANYLPARLTAPLLCVAAGLLRQRPLAALRVLVRDGRKHASPNAALAEAAVAGALGVQLGGRTFYDGQPLDKPAIGDPLVPLAARHIRAANALMFTTAALLLALMLPLRAGAEQWWAGRNPSPPAPLPQRERGATAARPLNGCPVVRSNTL
jgi:adenosylcobinamide-phosphate synthase